jgi:hypothetical protein
MASHANAGSISNSTNSLLLQPVKTRVKRWVGPMLCAFCLLTLTTGCLRYDITLQNGDIIRARNKPKRNEQGFYVFKDLSGKDMILNPMRVRQIEAVRAGSKPARPF